MRRAEMARRRKNLSEKRNEEEKVRRETLLLSPSRRFLVHPIFSISLIICPWSGITYFNPFDSRHLQAVAIDSIDILTTCH